MMNTIQFADKSGSHSHLQASAKPWVALALLAILLVPTAFAQAIPTAEASPISTGFALPLTAGTLQYGVSASESLIWGYYGGSGPAASTNLTGDLAYISSSTRDPFSVVLAGGRSWGTSNQPSYSFVNMGLSQVINVGRWDMVLSDNVSYLPGTPTTGLSGIPGLGDLGVSPIQVGIDNAQGILTDYSTRVANTASGSIQRSITGKTSANGSGYYSYTHFLNSTVSALGLDNTAVGGGGGISHEFDQRHSMAGNYNYSSYDYGSLFPGFVSQTASMSYTYKYSRKITLSGSAGPQWTTVQTAGSKASLNLFLEASAAYAGHFSRSTLSYIRSTNSGYGVVGGTLSDGITFSASRIFARVWSGSASAAFTRSTSLPSAVTAPFSFHTYVASAQATRALGRSLSMYTSFTFQDQSSSRTVGAVNVFSGRSEVLGFGITYSPTAIHFGRP